jgi:hypothetical protein
MKNKNTFRLDLTDALEVLNGNMSAFITEIDLSSRIIGKDGTIALAEVLRVNNSPYASA